jgi:hypothetical protein
MVFLFGAAAILVEAQSRKGDASLSVTPVESHDLLAVQAGADEGQPDAQLRLGRFYLEGQGVPRDRGLAYFWFNLAASRGSREAVIERDRLEKTLTSAQIAQSEVMSREWNPKEVLETPALQKVFQEQLHPLLREGYRDNFLSERVAKIALDPITEDFGEQWTTAIRFPGATSKACEVMIENPKHLGLPPHLACLLYSSSDGVRAQAFYGWLSDEIWGMMPEEWFSEVDRPAGISRKFLAPQRDGPSIELFLGDFRGTRRITMYIRKGGCVKGCNNNMLSSYETRANWSGAHTASSDTGSIPSIRAQIESVEQGGRYTKLPQADAESGSDVPAGVCVQIFENRTTYTLTVLFGGPVEREERIPAGGSGRIQLPAGIYKVVGRVPAPDVLPSFREQRCDSGMTYPSKFEIR